jgi:hypothetical protein
MGLLLGQQPKRYFPQHPSRFWTSTSFIDSRWLWWNFGMRPVHSKLYEIVLPTIYRTFKTDSVCDLGVRFIAHYSWTSNWARTWISLASSSGTRTGLASCLLPNLNTLVGLLLLQYMHQSWSYARVSCPHHSPSFEEKSSSTLIVLENDPAQHNGERGCGNKANQNNC